MLDIWFLLVLWLFFMLGWLDKMVELEKFYLISVLVIGYDILFFWVVRMMMFGIFVGDDVVIIFDGCWGL